MGVNQLQMGRRQPFYHVLVEDGTTRICCARWGVWCECAYDTESVRVCCVCVCMCVCMYDFCVGMNMHMPTCIRV